MIAEYTREAGVRNLERELGKVLRKAARRVAEEGPGDGASPIGADDLLGRPRAAAVPPRGGRAHGDPGRGDRPRGDGTGGDVLFVEASAMEAEGHGDRLVLTGQLGDVMRESAQIALSYTRSHAQEIGIDPAALAGARCTCTCRPARSPRTGRRRASRW